MLLSPLFSWLIRTFARLLHSVTPLLSSHTFLGAYFPPSFCHYHLHRQDDVEAICQQGVTAPLKRYVELAKDVAQFNAAVQDLGRRVAKHDDLLTLAKKVR